MNYLTSVLPLAQTFECSLPMKYYNGNQKVKMGKIAFCKQRRRCKTIFVFVFLSFYFCLKGYLIFSTHCGFVALKFVFLLRILPWA